LDLALPENAATFTNALEKVQELETEGSSGKGKDATMRDEADANDVEADLAEPSSKDATRAAQEEGAAGLGAGLEYVFRLFDRQSAAPQRRFKSRESMTVLRDLRFGSRRTRSRHVSPRSCPSSARGNSGCPPVVEGALRRSEPSPVRFVFEWRTRAALRHARNSAHAQAALDWTHPHEGVER